MNSNHKITDSKEFAQVATEVFQNMVTNGFQTTDIEHNRTLWQDNKQHIDNMGGCDTFTGVLLRDYSHHTETVNPSTAIATTALFLYLSGETDTQGKWITKLQEATQTETLNALGDHYKYRTHG